MEGLPLSDYSAVPGFPGSSASRGFLFGCQVFSGDCLSEGRTQLCLVGNPTLFKLAFFFNPGLFFSLSKLPRVYVHRGDELPHNPWRQNCPS